LALVASSLQTWRQNVTHGGHYCPGPQIDTSIVPAALRSHSREGPPGTADIVSGLANQLESAQVTLLRKRPSKDAPLVTGSQAALRQVTTPWVLVVRIFHHLSKSARQTRPAQTHKAARDSNESFITHPGAPHAGPGPPINLAVPPVGARRARGCTSRSNC